MNVRPVSDRLAKARGSLRLPEIWSDKALKEGS